jgi:hypothetical protein
MYDRLTNTIREQGISAVVIKSSAVGSARVTTKHLESAELRGIAIVAAQVGGAAVELLAKAHVSRTFGDRTTDEYVADDGFWADAVDGDVAKTRREAAFLILARQP